jgi:ADP-L-glycero-D-manno-heptose 6-epimerase
MKPYVVTGAAGFIGSRIVAALNQRGISEIIAVDNLEKSSPLRNLAGSKYRDYLHHREFLERFDGSLEAVFHQGACTNTMVHDRALMMKSNFEFSKELFSKCQAARTPLIYASSAAVYGAGPDFREEPACEHPLNVYAESKLQFDQLVRGLKNPAVQVAGLRYFNVYGPGEAHKKVMASMAFHAFHQYQKYKKIRLFTGSGGYGPGEQLRDFVYVDDVVDVNLWLAENRGVSGVFNCGTGRAQSFNQLAAAVINAAQGTRLPLHQLVRDGLIEYIAFPEGLMEKYQSYTQADLTRLRAAGYAGEFRSVEQGVAAYVAELRGT